VVVTVETVWFSPMEMSELFTLSLNDILERAN
jgi:hypothetical protein